MGSFTRSIRSFGRSFVSFVRSAMCRSFVRLVRSFRSFSASSSNTDAFRRLSATTKEVEHVEVLGPKGSFDMFLTVVRCVHPVGF